MKGLTMPKDDATLSAASVGSHGGGFNKWLVSIGKTQEMATDADEIQWLRLERQRLRKVAALTAAEREAIEMACKGERWFPDDQHRIDTLRALLDRLK